MVEPDDGRGDPPPGSDVPGGIDVTARDEGPSIVVTVSGDVDMLTGPRVRDELRRCLGRRPPLLVLDFSAVTFFGTAGLGLLVEARNAATPDTAVRVVAGTRTVLRPIQIAGLDQVVAVFDDVEQALAAERHGEPQGPQ